MKRTSISCIPFIAFIVKDLNFLDLRILFSPGTKIYKIFRSDVNYNTKTNVAALQYYALSFNIIYYLLVWFRFKPRLAAYTY